MSEGKMIENETIIASEHTGGWEISHEPPRWIIQAEAEIGKKAIAYMVGDYVQCAAKARLIAASPVLYALAEAVAKHFEGTDSPLGAEARAALAKAGVTK
jgi:hypothetical protein